MRSLDVSDYEITARDGKQHIYRVKEVLLDILFHPELKLRASEVMKRQKLAEKIEAANGTVLLEEEDYNKIRASVDAMSGFTRNDTELISRVMDAPTVEVEVKQE